MRPCTPHLVLGTAPTIVLGRHFYAASTIRRSAFGVLHTFIMRFVITNTVHEDGTKSLFRQIMALWYRHFIIHDRFGREYFDTTYWLQLKVTADTDPHVPDITTQDGLLDIIAVGCVLEFADALNHDRYSGEYDGENPDTIAMNVEAAHARSRFRVIMKTFGAQYTTIIGNRIVHPSYIWNRILVQFGAAMVTYMRQKAPVVVPSRTFTHQAIAQAVKTHLLSDHPHLVIPFEKELALNPGALTWNSSPIEVIPRAGGFHNAMIASGVEESREVPELPIYIGGDDSYYKGEWSSDSSDDGADDTV